MADAFLIKNWQTGRNGFDPPHSLLPGQVVEAQNVDFYQATLGRRRGGASSVSLTGGTAIVAGIGRIFRHMPDGADANAEMWMFGAKAGAIAQPKRLAGGTSWADVTLGGGTMDGGATQNTEVTSLNGFLWIATKNTTRDRLYVYDPDYPGGAQIREVGFTTPPTAPTATDGGGAGTFATTGRAYRIRWIEKSSKTQITRMSEPSPAVNVVPSGVNSYMTVTRPTAPGVGETHWQLEVSDGTGLTLPSGDVDGTGNFYVLGIVVIATTTQNDTLSNASLYSRYYPLADLLGEHSNWPSVRFVISDGNRLIGAGTTQTTTANVNGSRIYFSPVLGASDNGDLERVPINTTRENFVSLNEKDGGDITGLAKALNGAFYAFKRRQIWRLNPTGDDITPYLPRLITTAFGSVNQASITAGRDIYGNPAIYFWSEEGPCRLVVTGDGATSLQYLGEDIKDLTAQITFANFTQAYPCAIFHPAKHQVWFWFAYVSGAGTIPVKAVFDIMRGTIEVGDYIRGGWSVHTDYGTSSTMSHMASSACMFANTLGASMSSDLVPYAAFGSAVTLLKCDTTDVTDNGNNFFASLTSGLLDLTQFGQNVGLGVSTVLADPATVTIMLSMIRDYGLETRTSTVVLTPVGSESKVVRKFEDSEIAGAGAIQVQIGDPTGVGVTQWKLHELALTVFPQEPR